MKPIKILIALMVFATAVTAQAAPLLNGLALEQQFNKDRYIAAVYSDTLADSANVLLDNNTTRKLEVRIIADGLSARRFRNQWMEAIAINNSGDVLSGQAENMVTFANLFKGRFYKGDQLSVAFDGNSGRTTVSLNGVKMGQIADRNFFNTLLRAWVGPVPPSTDFRDGLLANGNVDSGLLGSYELLEPSADRVADVTASLDAQAEAKAEEPEASKPAVAAAPAVKKPKLAADIPPPSLASVGNAANEAAARTASQPTPNKPAPAQRRPQPKASAEPELDEEDEAPLTADMILARQIYHSMLLRHTYKFIRYPKRAQERGQEGSVRINVSIDSRGQIREIQTLQESRYATLNREAREAVERAGPYPAAPPQLVKDTYQFTVPITFRLPD